jgi:hypothetical protein
VAAFEASNLPFRTVYDPALLPSMPPQLERQIADLIAASKASEPPQKSRRQRIITGFGLAASFAMGLGVSRLLPPMSPSNVSKASPWIEAIATYQALYVWITVDRVADSPSRLQEVLREFNSSATNCLHAHEGPTCGAVCFAGSSRR